MLRLYVGGAGKCFGEIRLRATLRPALGRDQIVGEVASLSEGQSCLRAVDGNRLGTDADNVG